MGVVNVCAIREYFTRGFFDSFYPRNFNPAEISLHTVYTTNNINIAFPIPHKGIIGMHEHLPLIWTNAPEKQTSIK